MQRYDKARLSMKKINNFLDSVFPFCACFKVADEAHTRREATFTRGVPVVGFERRSSDARAFVPLNYKQKTFPSFLLKSIVIYQHFCYNAMF